MFERYFTKLCLLPVWPILVKSISMLVQECSGGALFSEIINIRKTLFSDMLGAE